MISAVLLIRFAIDFSEGMSWWLAAAFWGLVISAIGVGIANLVSARSSDRLIVQREAKRTLLLAAIPLGFLVSSLDCTGLSLRGCSPFCTFVKVGWVPLIAVICAVYFFRAGQIWLTAIVAMSFVPLAPHCVCYNVGNAWWIDRLGASPVCYACGFVVSIIAVSCLRRDSRSVPSVTIAYAVIAGATAFFVSHHYFKFPW